MAQCALPGLLTNSARPEDDATICVEPGHSAPGDPKLVCVGNICGNTSHPHLERNRTQSGRLHSWQLQRRSVWFNRSRSVHAVGQCQQPPTFATDESDGPECQYAG